MLRNIGSNWVLTLVTIAATYVLTPFVIHALGTEGYGTWTVITAITGYMSLLALGVPMASLRYLAQHVAEGDHRKMNQAIGSCAGLYLMIGATAMALGVGLVGLFVAVYDIPSALQTEARLAFVLMVVHVAAGFIGLLPEGIMLAHHDFVLRNAVRIGGVLLRLGLTLILLTQDASLVVLALIQTASLALDFSVSWILIRRRYPGVRMSLADFDWAMVRRIFSFSLYVLLLNAGARLTFETNALVIGAVLGVGAVPFYTVANGLIVYLMEFVIAIAAVVSPMATTLNAQGKTADLRDVFLKWSKVALSLTIMAGVFLIVLGPKFIGWWIGPAFEASAGDVLQILMLSSLVFLPVRGVALPVLMGLGKPRIPTVAFVAAGLLNLGLSLLLVAPLGLRGIALATAVPNFLFAIAVLVVTCRELDLGVGTYLRYVVPRAAVGALPLVALLWWFRRAGQAEGMLGLAAAGLATVVLFGLTWALFVYRDDPYVDMRARLGQFRAWSRA